MSYYPDPSRSSAPARAHRWRKPSAVATSLALAVGGLFFGQSLIPPEAHAAPTTHQIGTFPLHGWWASSHSISQPLKVDGETLYTGDDGDSWGYLKTNGEPVTDAQQTLFGTPSTTPTSATNPSPSGGGWIATVAVDANVAGKREAAYGYSWAWNAASSITGALRTLGVAVPSGITNSNTIPVYRIKNGETQAQWTTVPISSYFGQTGGNRYWSGGEVIQSTGQIFFSGGECAGMNDQFSMMIFDPKTGDYNFSGLIKPATAADNIFGTGNSCGGTGYVSSDMALDDNGNAYVLAVSNHRVPNFGITTTSTRSWLVRVVPSWDPAVDWTYELVAPISAGPGQNNVPVGADVGTVWGMAFYQGSLYAVRPDYNISQINVMSGQAFNIPPGTRVARLLRNIFDLASGQTAIVVQGTVYNDAGADGSVEGDRGLPGQQVALYQQVGEKYVYQGMRHTNEQGNYSFLVAGNGNYVVRLAQPAINGVNALQTYATGGGTLNPVTAQCVNGNVTDVGGAPCAGAAAMPAGDPPLPAAENAPGSDTSTQPDAMAFRSSITITSAQEVVNADFGITAAGSFGDTAAGPAAMASGAPAHINGSLPRIWLGSGLGVYEGPATDNTAHNATDDGVYIDSYAGKLPLTNTVLAGTKTYRLAADVSGPEAAAGTVTAWTTEAGNNTWVSAPAWKPTVNSGKAVGDYQYQSSGSFGAGGKTLQMRVNASIVAMASPTNAGGEYQSEKAWTTPGEIEDYSYTVADAVYRPAATTSGGMGTFTVAGASITTGKDVGVGPAVGTGAGAPVNLTASTPDSWTVTSVTIKETESGTVIAQPGVSISGGTASFSYTPAQGSDVIVEVAYARDPDPLKSVLSLDKESAQVGTPITATASVNDVNGEGLDGVVVTFGKKSADVSLSDSACTTDESGTCSVTVTSSVAATYPDEVSATVVVATKDTRISGSPKTVSFTTGTFSYTHSTFAVTPAADPSDTSTWRTADGVSAYAGVMTAKDQDGNLLTELAASGIAFTASSPHVTVSSVVNNKDGTYTVSYTSRYASAALTAALAYQGTPVGEPKPIPFKAGPADLNPECTDPARPGTNLAAIPAQLGVGGISNLTGLVTDSSCNPVPNAAVTFLLEPGSNAVLTVIQATTDADGKAYASLTDGVAETVTVRARIVQGELRGSPASVTFTTGGFSWMDSSFSVTPEADLSDRTSWLVADGTSAYTGVLTAKDNSGSPLPNLSVADISFAASNPSVTVSSVVNNQNGTYSVTFTSKLAAAGLTASASFEGAPVGTPKPIPFKAGPAAIDPNCPDPARMGTNLSASPASLPVGGISRATALVTDASCNPVPDSVVEFTLDPGTSALLTVVQATTDAEGKAYATLTDASAETVKVRARITVGELRGSPASVSFTTGGFSWMDSSFTVSPAVTLTDRTTWLTADGESAYTGTLTAKDNKQVPLTDLEARDIVFSASSPDVTVSSVVNAGSGRYTVTFVSKVAGTPTGSLAYQGTHVGTAKPIPFRAGPAAINPDCSDPARPGTNLTIDPAEVKIPGSARAVALVTDANCNPVEDPVEVRFSTEKSASVTPGVAQTGPDGKAVVEVSDAVPETVGVRAAITGIEIPGSPAQVSFLDVTAPVAPTIDKANATEVSGTSEPGTTIQVTWPDGTVTTGGTADKDGKWTVTTPSGMGSGTITVVAKDPSGNQSDPVSATLDTEAPRVPTIEVANATKVAGTSEPGTAMRVTWPDGKVTDAGTADKDGKWSIKTPSGVKSGTITVVAEDPAGNKSDPVSTTLDVDAPSPAVVNPSNGSAVTGTAEPGTTVRVTDRNGNLIQGCEKVLVGEDGTFAAIPSKPLKPGESVTVTVVDSAGNESDPVTVSIGDIGIAIAHPTRYPNQTQVVTGTTFNPGEKVCLTVTNATPVDVECQAVGKDGKVTFTFGAPQGFEAGTRQVTLTGETSGSVSGSFVVHQIQVKTGASTVTVLRYGG